MSLASRDQKLDLFVGVVSGPGNVAGVQDSVGYVGVSQSGEMLIKSAYWVDNIPLPGVKASCVISYCPEIDGELYIGN